MTAKNTTWKTKFQTPLPPETSVVGDSIANSTDDSLVIEDLDLEGLEISSSSKISSFSTTNKTDSDYDYEQQIPQIPGVVTEASTKNNLYILVRVPTNPQCLLNKSTASSQTSPDKKVIISEETQPNTSSNFNAARRIFSIPEEIEGNSTEDIVKKHRHQQTCWTTTEPIKEEFRATTSFVYTNDYNDDDDDIPCILPNQVPEQSDDVELYFQNNHFASPAAPPNSPRPHCQNEIQFEEVHLSSTDLANPTNMSLESCGILITPTKAPKKDNLLVFQVDPENKTKVHGSFGNFLQWMRRVFCLKKEKPGDGFLHAKVYKTYFVSWKKCSDRKSDCSCPCSKQVCENDKTIRRYSA